MNSLNAKKYSKCIKSDWLKDIIGCYGYSTEPNKVGNVMFYPENSFPCYRICLPKEYIEIL